jgi:type III secretory pathway lipoprotein EscJ
MEKGWKQVFLTGDNIKAEMARELLELEGINAVVLNQKDTVYQTFGDIEVYVNESDEATALEILKNLKN